MKSGKREIVYQWLVFSGWWPVVFGAEESQRVPQVRPSVGLTWVRDPPQTRGEIFPATQRCKR